MHEKEIRKASVLKPWLKHYPEELRNIEIPHVSMAEFLAQTNKNHNQVCLEYYGVQFTLAQIFEKADEVAKSLASMGIKEGDRIPVFLRFQPEFVFLFLGAEKVGAALICRDGTTEEYVQALQNANGSVAFVQDFLSEEEETLFYDCCGALKHIVALSPYTYAKKEEIPTYVENNIRSLYPKQMANRETTISWRDFMALGANYTGDYIAPCNPDRPLYHPYTSGSTGPSKEIIHTAATMIGVLAQLVPMMTLPFSITALMSILPPALIAIVSPVVMLNIATGNRQILDPYCDIPDVDLQLMRYQPNSMCAVTLIGETIRSSTRIPADYPLDGLFIFGGGAEPANNKRQRAFDKFLRAHNSPANYTMGYGQSEAGSVVACSAPARDAVIWIAKAESLSRKILWRSLMKTATSWTMRMSANSVSEVPA
ncbi:MAG: AMP-binding protein [Oscillospiraceae bacterium]